MTNDGSRSDPILGALVEAAEFGRGIPPVTVLSGGWLVHGTVVTSDAFRARTCDDLRAAVAREVRDDRPWKRESARRDSGSALDDLDQMMSGGAADDPGACISLVNCVVAGSGLGQAVRVPALRLRLCAIDAWWITSAEYPKGAVGALAAGTVMEF